MPILCSNNQSNPKGAAHACSGNSFRGGVSPRFTRRPKGQSTVEYVLIIAIIVLVVLIAGPWVSSAIRNQFNTVAGTLGNGITKGSWESDGTGGGGGPLTDADIVDPKNGTAFAVYSEDDHSLKFYKRRGVPKVGDMFNYRRVTQVYTGFEDCEYSAPGFDPTLDNWNTCETDTPWSDIRNSVTRINVVDRGIAPRSLAYWFYRFSNLEDADLSNLDSENVSSIYRLFLLSVKLTSIKMPRLTDACTNCCDAFANCGELVSLELPPSDFSNCESFFHMFSDSKKLILDGSDWNVQMNVYHDGFNQNATGVILPKAWQ